MPAMDRLVGHRFLGKGRLVSRRWVVDPADRMAAAAESAAAVQPRHDRGLKRASASLVRLPLGRIERGPAVARVVEARRRR